MAGSKRVPRRSRGRDQFAQNRRIDLSFSSDSTSKTPTMLPTERAPAWLIIFIILLMLTYPWFVKPIAEGVGDFVGKLVGIAGYRSHTWTAVETHPPA